MNRPLALLAILLLAIGPASATAGTPPSKAEITKIVADAKGWDDVDPDDVCSRTSETFGVVVVGAFAHDRGCMDIGFVVDGSFVEDKGKVASAALAKAGWKDADTEARKKLAMAWFEEVTFAFDGSIVKTSTRAFEVDGTEFVAPTATAKDGGVTVTAWIQEPSGMIWQQAFYQLSVTIGDDMSLSSERGTGFAVAGELLKE